MGTASSVAIKTDMLKTDKTDKPTVDKIFLSGQFPSNPFGGIHKGSPRSGGRGSARSGPNVIRGGGLWPKRVSFLATPTVGHI